MTGKTSDLAEAASALWPDVAPLSKREFKLFQELIYQEAGIHLSDAKESLLVSRLRRRVRELGAGSFGEYYRRITEGQSDELVRMLDAITTNETHFFREPKHFDLLKERLVPAWRAQAEAGTRSRRVRIWSAASSTGEEPYSLAMTMLDALPAADGWTVEIHASDISTRVLERAGRGVYPIEKAKDIPSRFLKAYMLRGTGDQVHRMKVGPEVRELVRFHRINLNEDNIPLDGEFDVVFCRNVLIYFDPPSRDRVIARLMRRMVKGGYLFLGHAEGLTGRGHELHSVVPSVYCNVPQPGTGRARRKAG